MSSTDRKLSSSPWQQLQGYLTLARISNSPTIASNVLTGAALAGVLVPDRTTGLVVVAMVLFYTAGMFLNDLCDYEIDCQERPERPLPSGTVSRSAAAVAVAVLFSLGSLILWFVGLAAFVSGLALIAVICAYDVWHKTNPLSPLVMATARLLVYVTAFCAFQTQVAGTLLIPASVVLALYLVGLTYIAKTERLGLTSYWPAAALFAPSIWFALQGPEATMLPLLALFTGWVVYCITLVYNTRDIGGAIGRLIAGIALVDGLALAGAGAPSGVLLALVAFGATLFLQRYIKGT
ncbi:MAG: UbiA family prenyltransferase [Gemmatimonadaceae bacterium]|nr:UbiA family prenyltransferase [Gloeobacterales cyanobacterium ES-bin-141]